MRFSKTLLPMMALLCLGASAQQADYTSLYGGGTFSSSKEISLEYEVSRPKTLKIFRVGNPEKLLALGGPRDLKDTDQLQLKRVKTIQIGGVKRYASVKVGKLEPGLYLAQVGDAVTGKALLILVTDLGLVVKYDGDEMLTYTADMRSSKARPSVVYLMQKGNQVIKVPSSEQGVTRFKTPLGGKENVYVAAKSGNEWVFSSSYVNTWNQEKAKVYLQTDRPIYRPGDEVSFKGIARAAVGLKPLAGQKVELKILAPDETEISSQTLTSDAYGAFDGTVKVPLDGRLGSYQFRASIGGSDYSGSFDVSEYVKPEYSVAVSTDKAAVVQGGKANFKIKAEYLFGGGVSGGKVSYSVVKNSYYRYDYYYNDTSDSAGSKIIQKDDAVLDKNGELSISVPLERDTVDYDLSFEASVTDEARREVAGSGSLTAYRSSVVLGVETPQYAYKVGDPITVKVSASSIENTPVSTAFTLEVTRNYWERNTYKSKTEKMTALKGTTDAKGNATLTFNAPKQGDYNFVARAKDESGNATDGSTYVWAYDGSPWYWDYTSLDIRGDKPEYQVGDTAKLTIQSPISNGYALITLEGTELGKAVVVPISGAVLTYSLPITANMQPNSNIGVTILGKGQYYTDSINLQIPPKDKFLNLEVKTDQSVYKPGEKVDYHLKLTDSSGKPVQAQLSLGVVDEGIYLISEDYNNIKDFFYAQKGNVVGTETGGGFYFGEIAPSSLARSPAAKPAMTEAVFAQNKDSKAIAKLRKDFKDTALWLPKVETDAAGEATVRLNLPDNLTTWRLTGRAITLTDKVGQDTYKIKTTLPIIARLATPRFLVRTDQASLRVIGQSNLTEAQQASLKLELKTAALVGLNGVLPDQTLNLGAGNKVTADFTVKANAIGMATLQASVLTSKASDSLERSFNVLPRGVPLERGWAGEGNSQWNFELPQKTALESATGKLFLTPSLVAAVSPALRYLAGYPYGCTEQTLSRFVPNLLAKRVGGLAQLPEEVAQNIDQYTADGLKRLYGFQHEDGGWGFWENDSSSVFITSDVILGLLEAKMGGYSVRPEVLERGIAYLSKNLQDAALDNPDAKAYAYYALAKAGFPKMGLDTVLQNKNISAYGLSLGVLAYFEVGQTDKAQNVLTRLITKATVRNQAAYWQINTTPYAWNDDQVEATAFALEGLIRLRPTDPLVAKVVNWLLLERKGDRWVSTKDTAAVVRSALLLSKVRGEDSLNVQVKATLNGKTLVDQQVQGQSNTGLEFPLSNFAVGKNTLSLEVKGTGNLYASANLRVVSEEDYLRPQAEGIRLARTYQSLKSNFDAKNGRYLYQKTPLASEVKAGDLVLVTVAVTPENKKALRYVLVNEPTPAGFSTVEDDWAIRIAEDKPRYGYDYYGWNYWFDGREVRDNRIEFYFSYMNQPVTFTYILRAETAGQYTALPSEAFMMYDPEVRGVGTVKKWSVK